MFEVQSPENNFRWLSGWRKNIIFNKCPFSLVSHFTDVASFTLFGGIFATTIAGVVYDWQKRVFKGTSNVISIGWLKASKFHEIWRRGGAGDHVEVEWGKTVMSQCMTKRGLWHDVILVRKEHYDVIFVYFSFSTKPELYKQWKINVTNENMILNM